MNRFFAAWLACTVFWLGTAGLSQGAPLELKQKWIPGKRYFQTMHMQQASTISLAGQTMEQKMDMMVGMVTSVTKHENGNDLRIGMKYEQVAMTMEMMGQKMSFDSAKPDGANDPAGMGKILGAMVGLEFRIVKDSSGKTVDVENAEEIFDKLLKDNPAAGMMKGMFNKESMAQMVDQGTLHNLPQGPVEPEATWPLDFQINMAQMGQVGAKGVYTFKGMAERGGVPVAEIANEAKLTMDLNGKLEGEAGGIMKSMGMKIEDGSMSGTTWFDAELGTARDQQYTQKMTLKMNNPLKPGEQISVPVTQTIGVTLTKVEDAK